MTTPDRRTREQTARSIAARIDWTPTVLAGGDPRVAIVEQVLRLAEHEARAEVERKVSVDVRMERPPAPDWGGEEDDNGVQLYHHAWDSTDGDLRLWVGPYAAGDSGPWWAVTVQAPGIDVTMRCAPDEVVEWAEMVKEAVTDGPALAARTPQPGGVVIYRCDQSGHPEMPCSRCEVVTPASLPAVPDGEGVRAGAVTLRQSALMEAFQTVETLLGYRIPFGFVSDLLIRCATHEHADAIRAAFAPLHVAADGEDVPARLDAAADALEEWQHIGAGEAMRDVADELREKATHESRAAVAAALARPTGGAT